VIHLDVGTRRFPLALLYNHVTPMATSFPPVEPASSERIRLGSRLHQLWRRVTEGLELTQLWSQFETEARSVIAFIRAT